MAGPWALSGEARETESSSLSDEKPCFIDGCNILLAITYKTARNNDVIVTRVRIQSAKLLLFLERDKKLRTFYVFLFKFRKFLTCC